MESECSRIIHDEQLSIEINRVGPFDKDVVMIGRKHLKGRVLQSVINSQVASGVLFGSRHCNVILAFDRIHWEMGLFKALAKVGVGGSH